MIGGTVETSASFEARYAPLSYPTLRVVCSMAKADEPERYTAMLKKLLVPTFEEQLKKGVATY